MIFVTALLFGLLSVSFAQENNAKKFAGVWIGTLDMGGQTMTVIFKLQEKDGKLSGTGESPEQGGGAIALENFVVNGNKLQFEIPAVQAGFDGVYKEDKKNIDGTLVINQQGMPLLLTKENDAKKFAGVWIGSIDAGGQAMTVIFKLQEKEGKLSGTGESPEQGGGAITLENFVINGNKIQFEIPAVQAGFDGVYKEDKKNIDGTLVINQQGMPLLLTKDEKAVIEPEKKFDSFWEGTLNVQGTNLRLVIKTFKKADGTLGAFFGQPRSESCKFTCNIFYCYC